ncbi:MAG TPA: NrsF family protein [Acetobacteraceae bacterium]|nr:NrsF family protein [Acetobacteraceae bacterium]
MELARAAGPIRPLPPPSVRLAQWTAAVVPLTAACVMAIGPRRDSLLALHQSAFVWVAVATMLTAVLAAASAFVLSVPGAERSPVSRVMPLAAAGTWGLVLVVSLTRGGDSLHRLLVLPFHSLCLIEIAGLGIVPGWALFVMLRRAAPLRRAWSAALATLAAVALGAAATQFLCPIDDPAHQLVGHFLPVAVLAAWGTIAGRRSLDWLAR